MTLLEAIKEVEEEYNAEVREAVASPGETFKLMDAIRRHEQEQIEAAGLYETMALRLLPILGINGFFAVVLRMGMRVQRKLDHPERTTSLLDISYSDGPGGRA